MVAPYQMIRSRTTADVDGFWAETVQHKPLKDGVADNKREASDLIGILRVGEEQRVPMTGTAEKGWKSSVVAAGATLYLDWARFGGVPIHAGDKIRATDRPNQPWFEVLFVDEKGHRRRRVTLGAA